MTKDNKPESSFRDRTVLEDVVESFRQHFHFSIYVLCFMAVLAGVAHLYDAYRFVDFNLYGSLPLATVIFLSAFLLGRYINMVVIERPPDLIRHMGRDFRMLIRKRFLHALPVLIFLPVFMSCFTELKHMIPLIQPYDWDPALARADAWLHGGYQPWELLQSFLGGPKATFVINLIYNCWFFVLFIVVYWQAFSLRRPRVRMQFFLAYLLTWSLLGIVLATSLASGGPCYYERIVGADVYGELMRFLHVSNETLPVWALGTQDMLWDVYTSNKLVVGSGISAMPSMHVAAALLFALVGWRYHWLSGVLLSLFFVSILIGSVHLAWHYAIDGYVSVILTSIIWWAAGKWTDRLTLPEGEILN